MPPRRQNERSFHEIEMEEMRRQIQLLQETVKVQQALLEANQRRFDDDGFGRDSSSSRSTRLHQCQPRMKHIKVDIPDFEGELQPDEFVDWLQAIERVFEYKEIPEEHKVKIVAVKLKKHALIWWENLKRRRKCEGKSKIKTWEKMHHKLTRKYLPPRYYQENFTQLQLSKTSSYQPIPYTKNHIDSQKPLTHQPISSFKPQYNTFIERNTKIPKCFKCQEYGHIALDCVNRKVFTIVNEGINTIFEEERENIQESFEEETMREPIYDEEYVGVDFCEECEEEGKGDPIYDEYGPGNIHEAFEKEEHDEPIYDEKYIHAEYGESLEVERSLQTTITKDMVCNAIIDNKICENVESNYMVEKLNLPTKERLHPYKLQWLNKDNEVKVSQHSIISFSIGNNYKENSWCDVISMDTWRPCQYDRCALYDDYVNTCTFVKDVIKLAPLPLNDGKGEFKLLGLSLAKEPFKDKTKLCLLCPIPKPPWENVGTDFPSNTFTSVAKVF
ncbi:putative transcription factor interactor and regulator CCHC(Zn) family [Medicago truncatula]|uniref:Putative transcription factor interactor and regulator CCHC(Zn) family n=1 Tax=Medicago truncatula TaxID=3880 RepID=A0A396IKE2_MEDTR|nr:putative transcription factor interactor and regulator CCHC(Zn) family [Medicago truncatula]